MNLDTDALLSDPEFVDQAIKRLSVSFLFNLMPWESARLFVDLLASKSLKPFLNKMEREALTYYELFLNLNVDHLSDSSIRLVSSVLSLKQTIDENETLNDNWKRTIIHDYGDAYSMRDTIAYLYRTAKERHLEATSEYRNGSMPDNTES